MCRQFGGDDYEVTSGWWYVTIALDEVPKTKIPISDEYFPIIRDIRVGSVREILLRVSNALSS